ncbi:hypothetical protein DL95DRAFT_405820 [Leptodontidium sp. 2 PMI_412]|nr:hypothetical protein DL95DRAFT_405820 [Leptodontidium sp. 2 PMI_412]
MVSPARIIFWLAVALHEVNALNAAAPYEMTYLYYAYKMEFLTTPAESRRIARGCTHSPITGNAQNPFVQISTNVEATAVAEGVQGMCTFFEFMRHVQTSGWKDAMAGKDVVRPNDPASITNPLTRTLNPDADRLAGAVNDITTIETARLLTKQEKIFSENDLASMGGGTIAWAKQLETVSVVVEASRKEMAKRLNLDSTNAELKDAFDRFQIWVDKAVGNLSTVHKFRVGDQARFLVPDQQGHVSWTSSPMNAHGVIDTRQYTRIDGTPTRLIRSPGPDLPLVAEPTFQVVNFEASFAAATAADSPMTYSQKKP